MAGKSVRARTYLTLGGLLLLLSACGGSPAGPSEITRPAPATAPTAQARPALVWPASLDAYARILVGDQIARWPAGASLRHCAPAELAGVVAEAAAMMTRVSGLQQTQAGPCNVQWDLDQAPGHAVTTLSLGERGEIVAARIVLHPGNLDLAGHEAGHALGLQHSPRAEDLMNATPRVDEFSRDELAVLAAMYPR